MSPHTYTKRHTTIFNTQHSTYSDRKLYSLYIAFLCEYFSITIFTYIATSCLLNVTQLTLPSRKASLLHFL